MLGANCFVFSSSFNSISSALEKDALNCDRPNQFFTNKMAKNHSNIKKIRSISESSKMNKKKQNETKKVYNSPKIENIRVTRNNISNEQRLKRITRNMAKEANAMKFEEPLQNVTEKLSNPNKSKGKNVKKDIKMDQHLATSSSNIGTHAVDKTLVECDMKRITRTMAKGINTAKAENVIEKIDHIRTQSYRNSNSLDGKKTSVKTANVKKTEKKQLVKHEIFLQNEICFAKMTGYRAWPAKVWDMKFNSR